MADFAAGKIQAFVGPAELGAPDDLEQIIVEFIARAKDSLALAVQELDSMPIAQAVLDAKWRGVDVRLVLEQDYLQEDTVPKPKVRAGETEQDARLRTQWQQDPPRGLDMNRDIARALLRSGVHVSADYNPDIFHQKFVIRDYRDKAQKTSALLTGSANFTHTDTHKNLNHTVIFNDYRICAAYRTEFAEIESGSFGRARHGRVPNTMNLKGVPVRVLFAPDHTPELEIMKQLNKATKRATFAMFTFAGSSGIDDALIILRRAGVDVRGALDPGQASQKWAASKWLHEAGVKLFVPRRDPPFGKLHHKLMVIDEAIVVAGSFNYTAPANEFNDENIFVVGSPYPDLPKSEGGPVDVDECAAICAFFRTEIDRIIGNLSEPYAPTNAGRR